MAACDSAVLKSKHLPDIPATECGALRRDFSCRAAGNSSRILGFGRPMVV